MHSRPLKNLGFTLMELMVTLTIAGIVLSFAIPSFNITIHGNRLTAEANELVTSLNLARSEAVKRGMSVSIRKVDSNSATNLGAGAEWENGWDVFTDTDSDGNFEAGDGDTLIRTYAPLPANVTLRGNNNFTNFIRYGRDGISNNMGSFVICDNSDGNNVPEANVSRLIIVNRVGRIRMGIDSNNNGIPEEEGLPVTDIDSCIPPFS